jgi:hypothetical protein
MAINALVSILPMRSAKSAKMKIFPPFLKRQPGALRASCSKSAARR